MLLIVVRLVIIAFILPYIIGVTYRCLKNSDDDGIALNVVSGYMILWGWIQLIVVPAIFLKMTFSTFCVIIVCGTTVVLLTFFVAKRRQIVKIIKRDMVRFKNVSWMLWCVVFIVLGQSIYEAMAHLVNLDDSFYVAMAQTALDTNTLMEYHPYTGMEYHQTISRYVLSPFPILVALMSQFTGVSAAAMAHTFLPAVLIVLVYMVWYLIARMLYKEDSEKTAIFMIIVMAVLIFSGYSRRTTGTFMYMRIWQGKAVLASLILPYLLQYGLRICQNKMEKIDWILLLFTMFSSCLVSSMGIMLGAIMLGAIAITDAIVNRRISQWKNIILCCLPNIIYAVIYILL